jgi:hypothetical protein
VCEKQGTHGIPPADIPIHRNANIIASSPLLENAPFKEIAVVLRVAAAMERRA